jgi:hypothetical protein
MEKQKLVGGLPKFGAKEVMSKVCEACHTTTIGGYFAIRISSQTTKKEVSKSLLLRTIILCKLLSFCDTITFVPVQSQVLRNSGT